MKQDFVFNPVEFYLRKLEQLDKEIIFKARIQPIHLSLMKKRTFLNFRSKRTSLRIWAIGTAMVE